jgi:glycosyltransferase involved in cell wall biosynthesis
MTRSPKITVIIPTRERCDVLESSLRTVTAQNYDNLDIIVSDNFSNDATKDVADRARDSRIRYLNTGKRLSMSHNWEFALSHVDDGWVTFIGDDDGLLPNSISSVVDIINTTDAKAIRSAFCSYEWPSITKYGRGQLIVPMSTGLALRDANHWLSKVMRGRERYNQLPMIYNGGFIHISILKEIKAKTGSFFLSVSPDIYSAVSISRVVGQYVYTNEPLAISGTSKHSTGNSFFSTNKERRIAPSSKFTNEDNLPFHRDMPLCQDGGYPLSLHACVYEAYLQSEILIEHGTRLNHADQLEIIMATAGKHRKSIEIWGEHFAEMHKINYHDARRSAATKRAFLQSYATLRKIASAANSVITDNLPIKDIFEASIAASVIRSSPGRMDTMRYLTGRLISLMK